MVDISISDDVKREWVQEGIQDFWRGFLERFAALLAGQRSFEPSPVDQRFINLLEGALENPVLHTADALWAKWQRDPGFKAKLNSWMLTQGWEPSSHPEQQQQNLDRAARLSCYILVTRLVFYQVLRRRFRLMSPLSTGGAETPDQLLDIFDARFGEAVQYSRDYETIFTPDKGDLGYTIPFLAPSAPDDWGRLVQRIEEFDFSTLDFEVIGQMYERLIGSSERRRFGQFYTSQDVVDLINAFCIRNPHDRVLDPACGGGTFLVRAYYRKRALAGITTDSPDTHERLLDEIFGIDIGAFPAQLSTINLAVRHLSDQGNYPRVAKASFFEAQAGIPLYDIPLTGDSTRNIALENIDAVVGNPPYIRQEGISKANKTSYNALFHKEWPGQTPLRACLRSPEYVKLRLLPEGGVIMSHSYPSDISREQFTRILPDLESARRRTKPRTVDLYDVFCGVLYLLKSGCQWRMLPADFPNWGTCYQYFQQWSQRPDPEQESILEQVLKKIGWRGPEKQWSERAEQLLHRGLPERQEHGQRRAEGL